MLDAFSLADSTKSSKFERVMIVQTHANDGGNRKFFLFFQKKQQFRLNYSFFRKIRKIIHYPKTNKKTFFCKQFENKTHKKLLFSLFRTKITFSKFPFFTLCFYLRKRNKYIKNCKILVFFTILRVLILGRGNVQMRI